MEKKGEKLLLSYGGTATRAERVFVGEEGQGRQAGLWAYSGAFPQPCMVYLHSCLHSQSAQVGLLVVENKGRGGIWGLQTR